MPARSVRGTDGDQYWDDAGILRVRTGSVPAVGASPAHWGIAVYDASGNPIFDTYGLIAVINIIGNVSITGGTTYSTAGPGTYAVLAGSTMTFNVARQVQAVATANIVGKTDPASSSGFSYTKIYVDGVGQSQSSALWEKGVGYTTAPHLAPLLLTTGPHTIDVRAATDNNTTTFDIYSGAAIVTIYGG